MFRRLRKPSYESSGIFVAGPGFPHSLLSLGSGEDYLEGGIVLKKALEWVQGKELSEKLSFSLSLGSMP